MQLPQNNTLFWMSYLFTNQRSQHNLDIFDLLNTVLQTLVQFIHINDFF